MSDCGIIAEQLILDPGIGFGKTLEHNLSLLGGIKAFAKQQRPVMAGASRKSFLARVAGTGPRGTLPASLAAACLAVREGAHLLRVHDVLETVAAVRAAEAILSSAT